MNPYDLDFIKKQTEKTQSRSAFDGRIYRLFFIIIALIIAYLAVYYVMNVGLTSERIVDSFTNDSDARTLECRYNTFAGGQTVRIALAGLPAGGNDNNGGHGAAAMHCPPKLVDAKALSASH